jgi:hypothetical protein
LYVVQLYDSRWTPKPYRPIYFGQAGNLATRGFPFDHHAFPCWRREAGSLFGLPVYISFYTGPLASSSAWRFAAEAELIQRYRPPCNRTLDSDR